MSWDLEELKGPSFSCNELVFSPPLPDIISVLQLISLNPVNPKGA